MNNEKQVALVDDAEPVTEPNPTRPQPLVLAEVLERRAQANVVAPHVVAQAVDVLPPKPRRVAAEPHVPTLVSRAAAGQPR